MFRSAKRDLAAMASGVPQGNRRKVPDHQYAPSSVHTPLTREFEAKIATRDLERDPEAPFVERLTEPGGEAFDPDAVREETQKREKQVVYVDQMFANLVQGHSADTEALANVCRESIQSIVADKDLFLCLGINPYDSDYPSRHSLHVCSVAISIGVTIGLDDESLADLGTGCLIHDVGMLRLDQRLYRSKRQLSVGDLAVLSAHPILTLEALEQPGVMVSPVARIIAYQIHERCDGSGYPRGLQNDEIHYLARIAAVADAYVGLVSKPLASQGDDAVFRDGEDDPARFRGAV